MNENQDTQSIEKEELKSFSTKSIKCQVCGNLYEKNKKGRTKEYCSPTCQEFNKYKEAMINKLVEIEFCKHEGELMVGDFWRCGHKVKINKK